MIQDDTIHQAAQLHLDAPSYLRCAAELVTIFAAGCISYEEYEEQLAVWWEHAKEIWQPDDLARLFRLVCLTQ